MFAVLDYELFPVIPEYYQTPTVYSPSSDFSVQDIEAPSNVAVRTDEEKTDFLASYQEENREERKEKSKRPPREEQITRKAKATPSTASPTPKPTLKKDAQLSEFAFWFIEIALVICNLAFVAVILWFVHSFKKKQIKNK